MPDHLDTLKRLWDIQKSSFDSAMTYSKTMLGLGYGGFFALWAGTKSYLGPRSVLWSALLIGISLFFYVIFEITQIALISLVMASFTKLLHENGEELAIKGYQVNSSKAVSHLLNAWKFVFPVCALIGLAGGMILIIAIVSSLHRL